MKRCPTCSETKTIYDKRGFIEFLCGYSEYRGFPGTECQTENRREQLGADYAAVMAKLEGKQPHIGLFRSGSGDWIGLYLDGTLVTEGHELEAQVLLKHLGLSYEDREGSYDLDEYGNRCPDKWEDAREGTEE